MTWWSSSRFPPRPRACGSPPNLPPECSAEVDRVQIERMITNLLSNALKFTPEGGQVTMSLQVQPDVRRTDRGG